MSNPVTLQGPEKTTENNTIQEQIERHGVLLHQTKTGLDELRTKIFGHDTPIPAAEGSSEPLPIQQQLSYNLDLLEEIRGILEELTERV